VGEGQGGGSPIAKPESPELSDDGDGRGAVGFLPEDASPRLPLGVTPEGNSGIR